MDKIRVNDSLLYDFEKKLLVFIAKRVPNYISSDHFTLLAFLSAVGISLTYLFAKYNWNLLLLGCIFYFFHWFGDSLDGTLARVRKKERKKYGYYVDHMLDSLSLAIVILGICFSGLTKTTIWVFTLAGILLVYIHCFLYSSVTNIFKMSFLVFGPTELRIFAILGNIALYVFRNEEMIFNLNFLDLLGIFFGVFVWSILVVQIVKSIKELS